MDNKELLKATLVKLMEFSEAEPEDNMSDPELAMFIHVQSLANNLVWEVNHLNKLRQEKDYSKMQNVVNFDIHSLELRKLCCGIESTLNNESTGDENANE